MDATGLVFRYDPRFLRDLPGDPNPDPRPRPVHGALWSRVRPTPVAAPRVLAYAAEVLEALGLDVDRVATPEFAAVFSGNQLLPGMEPYASNYGGHQFGVWAGQLGDGRAITLAEVLGPDGRRHELQLKGAGPTPYARHADGRAVLRSSLREFLCSEAMHHLGVPTTRALCLIGTGEAVIRDMFYDGRPQAEPGAIVCRVAPSFIRFGHFELPAARGEHELLQRLIDFTVARDFPELTAIADPEARRAAWFHEVAERSALLLAHWLRVGFVHGVMNTDNMSILGLTLDFGPYGFLDEFDPEFTPNTTDLPGRRYAYARQPAIAEWNLGVLAGALATVWPDHEVLRAGLRRYRQRFEAEHQAMTAAKFGLPDWRAEDATWVAEAYAWMAQHRLDHTGFFLALETLDPERPDASAFIPWSYRPEPVEGLVRDAGWLTPWAARVRQTGEDQAVRRARMRVVNPRIVPRNYLAQQAIDAASTGDLGPLEDLLAALRTPYRDPAPAAYLGKRPDWAKDRPGCATLSCSS